MNTMTSNEFTPPRQARRATFLEGLPPPPVPGDKASLYDIQQAAPILRQSTTTIRRYIRSGKIPADLITRPGKGIFFTGDQLVRIIALWAGHAAPAPPPIRRRRKSPVPAKAI